MRLELCDSMSRFGRALARADAHGAALGLPPLERHAVIADCLESSHARGQAVRWPEVRQALSDWAEAR